MRRLFGGIAAAVLCWSVAQAEVVVHVSPSGSDAAGDGTPARPFATPERARDAVRDLRQKTAESVTVLFQDGDYELTRPLALTAADGGTPEHPVLWKAAHRMKARFVGKNRVMWRTLPKDDPNAALLPEKARSHVLVADLSGTDPIPGFKAFGCPVNDAQRKATETPLALFQGVHRLVTARWPDEGWAIGGKQFGTDTYGDPGGRVVYRDGGISFTDQSKLLRWKREPELWARGHWCAKWADSSKRVENVDLEAGQIRMDNKDEFFGYADDPEFYVFNAFSELDRPGEWVVDRARRRLYVWPHADADDAIRLPQVSRIVEGEGLHDFVLDGFTFEGMQSDALLFSNAVRVVVQASVIRHTGGWGVKFEGGELCRVDGCDLYDIGEGGVWLRGGDLDRLTPARHFAKNCHIHHFGRRISNYRPGISLNGVGCRAGRNLVHHSDHIGIQFSGNDHYIGYNVLHDLCQHNDDAGTIYGYMCDLTQRGTTIEHNVVHMSGDRPIARNVYAIYLDAWTSGCLVRGNIVNRATVGIWMSGGQANTIVSNIVMNCENAIWRGSVGKGDPGSKKTWSQGRKSFLLAKLVEHQEDYGKAPWTKYPHLLSPLDLEDAEFAHCGLWNEIVDNVFVSSGKLAIKDWAETREYAVLGGNIAFDDDPGFVNYRGLDWNVRPGSPLAKKFGDDTRFAKMGIYDSATRVSKAVKFADDVTPPRGLGGEFPDSVVRIDVTWDGALSDGVKTMADDCTASTVPFWSAGKRVMAAFGDAPDDWKEYSFSFVPTSDGTVTFWLMGEHWNMTLYDDFKVEGATLADPDFTVGENKWGRNNEGREDPLFPGGNRRAYGIVRSLPRSDGAEYRPYRGDAMALANHDKLVLQGGVKVKKGVRVTASFHARAYKP